MLTKVSFISDSEDFIQEDYRDIEALNHSIIDIIVKVSIAFIFYD